MAETSEDVIRLYLDDDEEPFKTARPPLRFQFSTMHLADGPHRLRIEAHNGLAGDSIREIPFHVRNGVAITVSGLEPNQEIAGQVGVIINAYAGNTEVDFEPSRAETPQPIPTWAWLIFLVIVAFTMFYVLQPNPRAPAASAAEMNERVGERVFLDTCSKCHGEDGRGNSGYPPPKLKDDEMALDADPTDLVTFVAAGPPPPPEGPLGGPDAIGSGRPRVKMPAWGWRLTNAEFVAVLNHVRGHWGNQAPLILPTAKRPPKAISDVDVRLSKALQNSDFPELERLYSQNPERPPRLVREGGVDYSDNSGIVKALKNWVTTGIANVLSVQAQDAAYYEFDGGTQVYAHGTLVVTVNERQGAPAKTYSGAYIRMYVFEAEGDGGEYIKTEPGKKYANERWRIAFDFARVPMPTGCEPGSTIPGRPPDCPREVGQNLVYADVQRMLASLGQSAPNAPHRNFWRLPYDDFIATKFFYKDIPGGTITLINDREDGVRGWDTNLLKALRDGKDIIVHVAGKKEPVHQDIAPMPKGTPAKLSQNDLVYIAAWIDYGKRKDKGAPDQPPPSMGDPGMGATTGPAMGDGPAGEWKDDDIDFAGLLAIVSAVNPKASGAPHAKFWTKSYAAFVDFEFDIPDGKVKLLVKGKGAESNLVHALKGEDIDVVDSSGKLVKHALEMGVMPPKGSKVSAADIERIRRWIDHGAPEKKPAK